MILYELTNTEDHPEYQLLEASNGVRHYDFLHSIITASVNLQKPFLSKQIIKALNYHAIACLHTNAGEFRPCEVRVGQHQPPQFHRVNALMDDFVNEINRRWESSDPIFLASFALWRLNHIHPFINGNGRTSRAVCYFIICVSFNGLLPGNKILPELIRENRNEYVKALIQADESYKKAQLDLSALHRLIAELLNQQIQSDEP